MRRDISRNFKWLPYISGNKKTYREKRIESRADNVKCNLMLNRYANSQFAASQRAAKETCPTHWVMTASRRYVKLQIMYILFGSICEFKCNSTKIRAA